MRHAIIVVSASVLLASCQSAGGSEVRPYPAGSCNSEQVNAAVSHTIRSFYSALAQQDYAAAERLTTRSFHAFEVGRRYTGPELNKVLSDAGKAGQFYEWMIGPVEVRADCNVASANWENTGSSGTAQERKPRSWLESATLVRESDRWLIDFLHSTPKDPRK